MGDYENFDQKRIKHLEMIQAVVGRLGSNSFVVKGWAITVAGVFFGFAVSRNDSEVALVGLLPVAAFYGLDVYFLQAERLFRVLFDQVRTASPNVEPFFMGATSPEFRARMTAEGRDVSWQATSWRPTLLAFYGALALAGIFVFGILHVG